MPRPRPRRRNTSSNISRGEGLCSKAPAPRRGYDSDAVMSAGTAVAEALAAGGNKGRSCIISLRISAAEGDFTCASLAICLCCFEFACKVREGTAVRDTCPYTKGVMAVNPKPGVKHHGGDRICYDMVSMATSYKVAIALSERRSVCDQSSIFNSNKRYIQHLT